MIVCKDCCRRERWPRGKLDAPEIKTCILCGNEDYCFELPYSRVKSLPFFEETNSDYRHVWTDGSVDRGKRGAIAVISKGFVRVRGAFVGTTSAAMEYMAVLEALKEWKDTPLLIHCDWFSLVEHLMDRKPPVNEGLLRLYEEAVELSEKKAKIFKWLDRSQNKAGLFLEMIRLRFTNRKRWPDLKLEITDWDCDVCSPHNG